jgi:hypothetical protein
MSRTRRGVVGASLLLLAACSSHPASSVVSATGTNPTTPPTVTAQGQQDQPSSSPTIDASTVKITKCKRDSDDMITVEGTVRTTADRARNIDLLFEIDDADGTRLDSVFANVYHLAAGQKARFSTNSTTVDAKTFTCKLVTDTGGY